MTENIVKRRLTDEERKEKAARKKAREEHRKRKGERLKERQVTQNPNPNPKSNETIDLAKKINSLVNSLVNDMDEVLILTTLKIASAIYFVDEQAKNGDMKKAPLSYQDFCDKSTKQALEWHGHKHYMTKWLFWLLESDEVDPSRECLRNFLDFFPRLKDQLMKEQPN